jgi:hypothetical protein
VLGRDQQHADAGTQGDAPEADRSWTPDAGTTMTRPTRHDVIAWAAAVVLLGLLAVQGPRVVLDLWWVSYLGIAGLFLAISGIVKRRRARDSWVASLRGTGLDLLGFATLAGTYIALSARFGQVRSDPFGDVPLTFAGWLLLAILVTSAWIAVARLLEIWPFTLTVGRGK